MRNSNRLLIGTAQILPRDQAHSLLLTDFAGRQDEERLRIFWKGNEPSQNYPFIGMRYENEELILSGMRLPENMRGQGIGEILMEIFFRISDETGIPFNRSGVIRKPAIARALEKFGFSPEDSSSVLQISSWGTQTEPPKGNLYMRPSARGVMTGTQHHTWYQVLSIINLLSDENPPEDGIPMETKWTLTNPEMNARKRGEVSDRIPGPIRIYGGKVLERLQRK